MNYFVNIYIYIYIYINRISEYRKLTIHASKKIVARKPVENERTLSDRSHRSRLRYFGVA